LDSVEQGERVEAELGRLIEKRHESRVADEGERPAEEMWSTRWEVSDLTWDYQREVWIDADGIAYDGARLYEYSRQGERGEG